MDLADTERVSGDQRLVYECLCAFTMHHTSEPYPDGELNWTTREQTVKHIIAPSQRLAETFFQYRYRSYDLISCIPICSIDNEVSL